MILFAFVVGMLAVPLVVLPEQWAQKALPAGIAVWTAWAVIEETIKYLGAALLILPRRAVNEAPDYVVYMLTVALGFAAAENMLFLVEPVMQGDFLGGLVTNNLRFIGATLLHVVASSAIGFTLAFSYQHPPVIRTSLAALGLILAVALHAGFNMLIMIGGGSQTLSAFLLVWSAAVVFFALFEILKYFRYRRLSKTTC
jgi:RsiW-degrading membrane proteinase PrsW (M82 family)